MTQIDLLIVGAGFAGLACARAAAEAGLKVVVIDRKAYAGQNVHTTGILVQEASRLLDLPEDVVRPIRGVKLYTPSLDCVSLYSDQYIFRATDTPRLLQILAEQATLAGAELFYDTPFHGAEMTADAVILKDLHLKARWLIGADGARSRVAERMGLGVNRAALLGLEVEMEGVRLPAEDTFYCFLDQMVAWGYIGWAVPSVKGVLQVGVATRLPTTPRLRDFVAIAGRVLDMKDARVVSHRGGRIPVGGLVNPFAHGRVILVGDAAGMVSPLTAGGIHTALHYGKTLGKLLAEQHENAPQVIIAHLEKIYPRYRFKRALRWIYEQKWSHLILNAAIRSGLARLLARPVFYTENVLPN